MGNRDKTGAYGWYCGWPPGQFDPWPPDPSKVMWYVVWADDHLDAQQWIGNDIVKPEDAALLLTGRPAKLALLDRDNDTFYKALASRHESDPQPRSLVQWRAVAREKGMDVHAWFDWYRAHSMYRNSSGVLSPAAPYASPVPLPSGVIAQLFSGLNNRTQEYWASALGDARRSHPWLAKCRCTPGKPGRGGAATWNPVCIAVAIASNASPSLKRRTLENLDTLFNTPTAREWHEAWVAASDYLRDENAG